MRTGRNRRITSAVLSVSMSELLERRLLMARDLYVDVNSPGPIRDGSSWAGAYADLQLALAAAASGDRILLADGTYKPTATTDRTVSFQLKEGVRVLGGYAGYGAPNPDARDVGLYPAVLSGDIGTPGNNFDNSYHVITGDSSITRATILDGVTVTAGRANEAAGGYGGGMRLVSASPTLVNCTFSGNSATQAGGAMYNSSSSPALTNCTFTGNSTDDFYSFGGGMANDASSSPILTNCRFVSNRGPYGAAMSNESSSPVLTGCTFVANAATSTGGGMYNSSSTPALTDCVFSGNSAIHGAGILNSLSSPTLANCVFSGNFIKDGTEGGAGMYNSTSSPVLANCTFSGNVGLAMSNTHSSFPVLTNCIVWGNGGTPFYNSTSSPLISYSAIEGGHNGTGNRNADPQFVRTPWRGPDGVWGTADDDYGDLRLRSNSVLLDAGSNAGIPAGITTDFAGDARVQNGTVDMGAYEGPVAVSPRTLYVDASAVGSGTGTSWADAFPGLQSALRAATDGDTIRVADGTYKPVTTTDRSIGFALRHAVAIYGGYAGYGAANPDARDVAVYKSILSGDIGTAGNSDDNTHHVVTGANVDATAVLDGFTIAYGNARGSTGIAGVNDSGGGMYLVAASPVIRNCVFLRNLAEFNAGGGLFMRDGSSPRLINCTFAANRAYAGGGVHSAYGSTPVLTNCQFIANAAELGGGFLNGSGMATLTNCTFVGNSASNQGGAIFSTTAPVLTNCVLWANTAPTGAAISGPATVSFSDVQGGFSGTGNIDVDPLFVRNPSPGADGVWRTADDDYGDLQLPAFSPVADAGDNNAPGLAGITTDFAGQPRFADIPTTADSGSGASPVIDIGAYEAIPALSAWTAGPYRVLQGTDISLSGRGASDVPGALGFAWDWDNDGVYDDAAGRNPVFATGSYSTLTTIPIRVRVTDGLGRTAIAATTVTVVPMVIYVDDSASGAGNGASWSNAYPSLQTVLELGLLPGCEVRAAAGVYKPTTTGDRTISFRLQPGVKLVGGYAGHGASNPDARDPGLYATILTGDIGFAGSSFDNSYHVVTGTNLDSTALMDGFTITSGNANGSSSPANSGGGLYLSSASPTIRNCTFTGNAAKYGAGVFLSSSTPLFEGCTFTANSASTSGGGVYTSNSGAPVFANSLFIANSAATSGGAMFNYSSSPVLANCSIVMNSAASSGAVYNNSAAPTLVNCIAWFNASSSGSQINGWPTITYSDIEGGFAGTGNVNVAPRFVRNPWTGPDGVFGTADDDYGDLRLRSGSPALDIGSNAGVPAGIFTDLSGQPRVQNGTVDLGAYEGPVSTAAPRTLYVDLAAVGTGTGDSWANAFNSLQSALQVANEGDTIRIADGVYRPSTNSPAIGFALRSGVAVYGGYAGFGASDPDARNVSLYPTVLSGDIGTPGNSADNSYHVVTGNGGIGSATILDGVTITAGRANGVSGSGYDCGGGMYLVSASPTVRNCVFLANSASYDGGGLFNNASSPALINCVFVGNSAAYGGGIKNRSSSSPVLTSCTITANSATFTGGGVHSVLASASLTNCIIWGNSAQSAGNISSSAVVACSDVQSGYAGTGNINADPLFVRSPSPGVDAVWGTGDDDYGDLRLQQASPCIDAGSTAAIAPGVTTDLAGKPRIGGSAVDMGAYEFDAAPAVTAVSVNGGATQRSMVRQVSVTFSTAVTVAPGAITVLTRAGLAVANVTITVTNPSADQQTWLLTFSGSAALGGSLPDGVYDLTITASGVQDGSGNMLGGNYTQRFHRLFGDVNGDRKVNLVDYTRIRTTLGRSVGDALFNSALDWENSGTVNTLDLGQFRRRFGRVIS